MKTALTLTIDCHKANTVLTVHKEIARQLHFPKHYGHNLDALHDCLTDISLEHTIRLTWIDSALSRTQTEMQAIHSVLQGMHH